MDKKAMYKLSYGLFVVTARHDGFDNGCITNTVGQVTSQPNRISLTINKDNLTHEMIQNTAKFNVSVISQAADFALSSSSVSTPEEIWTNLPLFLTAKGQITTFFASQKAHTPVFRLKSVKRSTSALTLCSSQT